jgi:hypothetical protein
MVWLSHDAPPIESGWSPAALRHERLRGAATRLSQPHKSKKYQCDKYDPPILDTPPRRHYGAPGFDGGGPESSDIF